jgi:raffinose/stachyose/melibiose transport system substrate-binding protein
MTSTRFRLAAAAAALPLLAVAGCSSSSGSSSSAGSQTSAAGGASAAASATATTGAGPATSAAAAGGKTTTISLLVDNSPVSTKLAGAVVAAFEKANPDIKVDVQQRPAGADGDNLVKTKLATGEMSDVFWYNSGALLQALAPAKSMVDLTGDPAIAAVDKSFLPVVSVGGKVYGAPWGSSFAGGVLYNKAVYAKLGLQVPKTWTDFLANSDKIKAAGLTAIEGSFKDTWTTQLIVLGDYYNLQKTDPSFTAGYTANKAKYATTPAALNSFQKMETLTTKGYYNKGAGSTTEPQALAALAAGKAGQYPMLSTVVSALPADQLANLGFFGLPGDSAADNGATVWEPGGAYIPKTSKHIDAAKKFVAFTASVPGTVAENSAVPPTGPYLVTGSTLPSSAPQAAKDLQAYVDAQATSPALEFLSPVKGPNLEQITTAVATGQTKALAAAKQYDQDVTKEAKQLGLPGW